MKGYDITVTGWNPAIGQESIQLKVMAVNLEEAGRIAIGKCKLCWRSVEIRIYPAQAFVIPDERGKL